MKKKKNKTNKSSSNQINGPDSSTFHVSIATTAVAQICHSVGYKATQTTALQTLTNITVRYLSSLATSAANSAVSTGRTECNLYDVIRGLEDAHADVGFKGNSAVTKRLMDSEMLKDVMRFVSWSREVPFAKPLVTSSCGKKVFTAVNEGKSESNGNEKVNLVAIKNYCGEKEVFTAVNEGESDGVKEKNLVPRGKQMVTSSCENDKLNHVARKNYCGEKEVFTVVNEGEKEKVPRGRQMVTSLCENDKLNCVTNYGEKEVFTAVNEAESEGVKEKKVMPRGKQMVTSLCENEKLNRVTNYGEKEVFTAVNEGESEGVKEKKVPRGRQMVTSAYGEMSHVPKWLPEFPRKIDCGERVVFTEGKSESEKEKVSYYKEQEVSELPVVRKRVRFEIGGKSGRGKDVINLKFGVDLRSGVCKGGKRILCQIYDDGEKYVNGGGKVVKKSMVKMKSTRRYTGD